MSCATVRPAASYSGEWTVGRAGNTRVATRCPVLMTRIGNSDLDVLPPLTRRQRVRLDGRPRRVLRRSSTPSSPAAATSSTPPTATAPGCPGNTGGDSETIIGEWLASRRPDGVVVATKVSQHPDFTGLSATNVRAAAEASLQRLGVDAIDLYYAHFDDATVPLEETVARLRRSSSPTDSCGTPPCRTTAADRIREWIRIADELGVAAARRDPAALQPRPPQRGRGDTSCRSRRSST